MKIFKKILNWAGNVVLLMLVAVAILSIVSFVKSKSTKNYIPGIGSYKFLAVLSGSMNPTFNTYDMIIDKLVNAESLKTGDVITFRVDDKLVTHRITQVTKKDNYVLFKTKGDANNVEDEGEVLAKNVVGKYVFHIPYLGLVMSKIRGPVGIGIIWAIFTFIVVNEILSEIFKSKKNKKQMFNKGLNDKEPEKANSSIEDIGTRHPSIINPNSGYISEKR
jgi:signal peptidase I